MVNGWLDKLKEWVFKLGKGLLKLNAIYVCWFNSLFPAPLDAATAPKEDYKKLPTVLANVLLFGFIASVVLFVVNVFGLLFNSEHSYGTFGDFFGGVLNPILTFLTLFGLIATIVIQRQELRFAREEYSKTSSALNTQAIETTFFNLLDLHNNIVSSLVIDRDSMNTINSYSREFGVGLMRTDSFGKEKLPRLIYGRDTFQALAKELKLAKTPREVVNYYDMLNKNKNHIFGHYFRNLYQILKVIDRGENEEKNREYSRILRAQLSFYELAILFLNCLQGINDKGQFKALLIKYQMLEHLTIHNMKVPNFTLAQSFIVSPDSVLEYAGPREDEKCFGGAFGNNLGIPRYLERDWNKEKEAY